MGEKGLASAGPWWPLHLKGRGLGLEATVAVVSLLALIALATLCQPCQLGSSYLKPDYQRLLLISGIAMLVIQSGAWFFLRRGAIWAKQLLMLLSLGTLAGGGALFLLSLHFPAPKCWLCLIFWLTQGFFALRLRAFDESWKKFLPVYVVTLAISGSIVKFTPSAKDVFAELPFVEVKTTPDWVGKSLKSLLPDVRTAEIVVVAKCSKCNENRVVTQAAADRQAKVRRVYILSEETKDLAKFLSGQDVRTISLRELTKLLGPIENPYRIQITNYTIVEMKPI